MLFACVPAFAQTSSANIYNSFVDRLRKAERVSGEIKVTVTSPHSRVQAVSEFTFQKPNLFREESWNGKTLAELQDSDGVTTWLYNGIQNTLAKQASPAEGYSTDEILLQPFSHPGRAEFAWNGRPPVHVKFQGKAVLKFGLQRQSIHPQESFVYMDPKSNLPVGFETYSPFLQRRVEAEFKNLRIGPKGETASFTYVPTVEADQPEDADALLLPVGSVVPTFKGTTSDGALFDLATVLKGSKATLLDFWGLGCPPCRAEMPKLQELLNKNAKKGLSVVTIDMFNAEPLALDFIRKTGLKLPVVFAASCTPNVALSYKAQVMPSTYLIDSNGVIVGHYIGDDVAPIQRDLVKLGF